MYWHRRSLKDLSSEGLPRKWGGAEVESGVMDREEEEDEQWEEALVALAN